MTRPWGTVHLDRASGKWRARAGDEDRARPTVTLTSRLPGCLDDADALDAISDRKGGDPSEWPEDLRVREWPRGRA